MLALIKRDKQNHAMMPGTEIDAEQLTRQEWKEEVQSLPPQVSKGDRP